MPSKVVFTAIVGAVVANDDRLAMITEIQNTPGVLWKAGLDTRFQHEPIGSSKILAGVKAEAMARRAKRGKVAGRTQKVSAVEIPESFDSEANWPHCAKVIGDIRDQSNCGCCWAFAAASAASDRLCIATNASSMVPLSAQDVCFCASDDGCDGGDIESPWDYIKSDGAVTGGQYQGTGPFGKGFCVDFSLPHCHHHGPQGDDPYPAEGQPGCPSQTSPACPKKCDSAAGDAHSNFAADKYRFSGKTASASGEDRIQTAIMEGGPVETAFTVYSDFENYVSGIYHHVSGDLAGGHAVRIVGWGVDDGHKYWKIANSWNPHWGEKGYFRITRGSNHCGVEDEVTFSPADSTWSGGGSSPTPGPSPPGPSPPTPSPPQPTPSPPQPGCDDKEDFCKMPDIFNPKTDCDLLASDCKKTCGCCVTNPPSYCSGPTSEVVV